MKNSKIYVELKDLKDMLKKDKNISSINDKIFMECSYVSLINPYKDYLCINNNGIHREYPKDLEFKEFKQLARIDDFLSSRIDMYIKFFEQSLKAYLTNVLCDKMKSLGNDTCDDYLLFQELLINSNNQFDMLNVFYRYKNTTVILADPLIVKKNIEVIEKIIRIGTKKEYLNNYLYNHYKNEYNTIPLWVVLHQLTLGELQSVFNMLKIKDRVLFVEKIYNQRKNNSFISKFSNKINYIRLLRNIINHYEPLIPFIINIKNQKEQKYLIKIICILKMNYYSSVLHNNLTVKKPKIAIQSNI